MTEAVAPRIARRWSLGRLATGMAVVAVCVPIAIDWLVPPASGLCDATLAWSLGLIYLGARLAWLPWKVLNDTTERCLAARDARNSPQHPTLDPTGLPSTP